MANRANKPDCAVGAGRLGATATDDIRCQATGGGWSIKKRLTPQGITRLTLVAWIG